MDATSIVLTAVCLFGGLYFFIRNVRMLMNETRLLDYLNTSPKGKAWIAKFGLEKTVSLSKKYFIPVGCVVSLALFGIGVRNLIVMFQVMQ